MAFHSILRRGSASCFSLAVRSVAARRPFHGAISAVQVARQFLPFFRISTAVSAKATADVDLVRTLESEIECAEQPSEVADILEGIPFEIQDNPGGRTIVLNRKHQDETIKVELNFHMVVSISKGDGQCLKFRVNPSPDEISIQSLSFRNSEDQLSYEWPDFNDLDENLQKAFHEYLETRGINLSMTKFLFKYIEKQKEDNEEHLLWLKNLKGFIEK